ncbi:hypothetical protein [Priestia megaterium]|uniref:hypothetical protein n=1 Tax=Priestia megaterium TaxID=1404 RepID=UPI0023637B92|nr:hypothetical protein [Priestia megaterium]MDD1513818.1 hypothetical protein [Priestia megaterium]
MTIFTVDALLENNSQVLQYYQTASRLWEDICNDPQSETSEGLSRILSNRQLTFEERCGGRPLGQEVMVWVGFGQLYSPYNGYTDDSRAKAHLLKEAFRLSYCSFEVKSLADDASSSYDVE